ncbi:MAG: TlpA disulfide reductase family protein, partial [Bacteroidota bacterium]
NSTIKGLFVENVIEGIWIDHNRGPNYHIPFVAYHGRDYRFTKLRKTPTADVSGKWEVTFLGSSEEDSYKAIGVFEQEENQVTGTFVTETGDYRFLEGTIQEDRMYLSVFDGAHAFLFGARVNEDNTLDGFFLSGSHYKTLWEAKRNPAFNLRDANALTYLKDDQEPFNFTFENPEGKMVSLNDAAYQGKVKIVQIFGTWFPNCRDETKFLVDYLSNNPNDDLAVIGLAFEKQRDKENAMAALRRYKDKFGMDYELLLAGATHIKAEASEILPMLNKVISYPTMIFLDRNNEVKRIHTGFNGPATDEYPAFKADFQDFMDKLLAEETL